MLCLYTQSVLQPPKTKLEGVYRLVGWFVGWSVHWDCACAINIKCRCSEMFFMQLGSRSAEIPALGHAHVASIYLNTFDGSSRARLYVFPPSRSCLPRPVHTATCAALHLTSVVLQGIFTSDIPTACQRVNYIRYRYHHEENHWAKGIFGHSWKVSTTTLYM